MSMTHKRLIALVIVSLLSIGAAARLSGRQALNANDDAADETASSEMLEPAQDASTPPTWLVSDFSWM